MTDNNTDTIAPVLTKTGHKLPPEVTRAFAGADTESRNAYAHALRTMGWTLQSISAASGVTRERIRQIVADINAQGGATATLPGPVPTPPAKPVKTPRVYVEPDPAKLARLLALKPIVAMARASTTDMPEVVEFNKLINEIVTADRVPLYRLAMRLGVTHSAVRGRLVRYGFKDSKGTSKAYSRVGSSTAPEAGLE